VRGFSACLIGPAAHQERKEDENGSAKIRVPRQGKERRTRRQERQGRAQQASRRDGPVRPRRPQEGGAHRARKKAKSGARKAAGGAAKKTRGGRAKARSGAAKGRRGARRPASRTPRAEQQSGDLGQPGAIPGAQMNPEENFSG
jgi:hypothetical protein